MSVFGANCATGSTKSYRHRLLRLSLLSSSISDQLGPAPPQACCLWTCFGSRGSLWTVALYSVFKLQAGVMQIINFIQAAFSSEARRRLDCYHPLPLAAVSPFSRPVSNKPTCQLTLIQRTVIGLVESTRVSKEQPSGEYMKAYAGTIPVLSASRR